MASVRPVGEGGAIDFLSAAVMKGERALLSEPSEAEKQCYNVACGDAPRATDYRTYMDLQCTA